MIVFVALVALSAPAATQPPTARTEPRVATLACGTGRFRLESRVWPRATGPRAPFEQVLTVEQGGKRRAVPLELGSRVTRDGFPVRQSYVSLWACPRASTGKYYVHLFYACAVDAGERGDCGGNPEWSRLLDPTGRRLDATLPRQGAAQDRLQRRLGLTQALEEGLDSTDVLEAQPATGTP